MYPEVSILLNGKQKCPLAKDRRKTRMPEFLLPSRIVLKILDSAISQEKGIRGIGTRKAEEKIKPSLFADEKIIHLENRPPKIKGELLPLSKKRERERIAKNGIL